MSRVESMKEEGESYSVKFLEVTRIYSKDKSTLICLFEGKDEKYYANRLNIFNEQDCWRGVNTGGRSSVLKLVEIIDNHLVYKNINYAGFIDKDFEDWFENPNPEKIYVTPCYSIENFYITESCFKQILSAEFNVTEFNENKDDFKRCVDIYTDRLAEFLEGILVFNCWVKAHGIMRRDDRSVKNLNVNNIKTKDLIRINIDKSSVVYDLKNPFSVFKNLSGFNFCQNALREASESFQNCDRLNSFRGKQQIDFIREIVLKLKNDRTSKVPVVFSEKGNVSISISKDNAISELSQYADTPTCLKSFLEKIAA